MNSPCSAFSRPADQAAGAVLRFAAILAGRAARPGRDRPPWRNNRRANLDESKVGPYTLPDPLMTAGGRKVATSAAMEPGAAARAACSCSRPTSTARCRNPPDRSGPGFEVSSEDKQALGGTADPPRSHDRVFRQAGRSADGPLALPAQDGRPPRRACRRSWG